MPYAKKAAYDKPWWIAPAILLRLGLSKLGPRAQRDQMRDGHLVGDLRALDVRKHIETACLYNGAAISGGIGGMSQAGARQRDLSQVIDRHQCGDGYACQHQSPRQGLPRHDSAPAIRQDSHLTPRLGVVGERLERLFLGLAACLPFGMPPGL